MSRVQPQAVPTPIDPQGYLPILPIVKRNAAIRFRHFQSQDHDDAVQEAVAQGYVAWLNLSQNGRSEKPSMIATYAVLSTKHGDHVGGSKSTTDVLSPQARQLHSLNLESLDRSHDLRTADDGVAEAISVAGLIPDPATPIPDQVAFKLDFSAWYRQWPARDKRMMNALAAGFSIGYVADKFGLSDSRVTDLRWKWRKAWIRFTEPESADMHHRGGGRRVARRQRKSRRWRHREPRSMRRVRILAAAH